METTTNLTDIVANETEVREIFLDYTNTTNQTVDLDKDYVTNTTESLLPTSFRNESSAENVNLVENISSTVRTTLNVATDLLLNWTLPEVVDWNSTSGYPERNITALRTFSGDDQDNNTDYQFPDDVQNINTTIIIGWGDSIYPSGYSTLRIILTAIFVTSLMIIIVVGNMLVIIAIATEKTLKTIQNWFIASLAVSDFLLGLIVMPFSLANELMGYWIFGTWWCEIHQAVDVLLCTASILNICMISLDRYWSITKAVEYLKQRTPLRAAIMICLVWVASFVISVPPLLGWKKPGEMKAYPECQVSADMGYVIYSSMGSFYIPSVIMVFVYIRIYIAARSRARRAMKKKNVMMGTAKDKSTTTTSFSNASPPDKSKNSGCPPPAPAPLAAPAVKRGDTLTVPGHTSTVESSTPASTPSPERRHEASTSSPSEVDPPSCPASVPVPRVEGRETCAGSAPITNGINSTETVEDVVPRNGGNDGSSGGGKGRENGTAKVVAISVPKTSAQQQQQEKRRGVYSAVPSTVVSADEADCVSELEHSSDSDQYREGKTGKVPLRRLHHLCRPPNRKSSKERRDEVDLGKTAPKIRDPEREKRRIARKKERRATLILGLIMASFILSWLPFFVIYLLTGLCKTCVVPELAFAFAFWLGYCNSALNPIIYTIFNKDFRRAFRKILFK